MVKYIKLKGGVPNESIKKALTAAAVLIGTASICFIDTQPLIGNIDTLNTETYSDQMQNGALTYKKIDEDDDGTYDYIEISNCDKSVEVINIPSEIEGLPVMTIDDIAFKDCSNLTSIEIPNQCNFNWVCGIFLL